MIEIRSRKSGGGVVHVVNADSLVGQKLRGLKLNQADLSCMLMSSVDLAHAALVEVDFDKAMLEDVQFQSALLTNVRFHAAQMSQADFSDAFLVGVSFQDADLRNSSFRYARIGGTGLGLSISKELIEMMSGQIEVESELGRGTKFRFQLRLKRGNEAAVKPLVSRNTTGGQELPPKEHRRDLRILLAEDNAVNQKVATLLLAKLGHKLTVVEDGRQAVETARQQRFDVILMDVQMPVMDGLSACAEIRRQEGGTSRRTPIIAMTAHAMKGDRQRCLEAGMDGYVSKPIHPQELYDAIDVAWRPEGGNTLPPPHFESFPAAENLVSVTAEPSEVSACESDAIDWQAALRHTAGDVELMQTVISVFLQDFPRLLKEIRQAIAARDAPRLRRAGHTLKGSCGIFQAHAAYQAAAEVEKLGCDEDFGDANLALAALMAELDQLRPQLEAFVDVGGAALCQKFHDSKANIVTGLKQERC